MTKTIETRKNEIRIVTSNPQEMLGKFLAKRLLRSWKEDFADEDTGEIVSIERNEIIAELGQLIDGDMLARIQFHMETGEVKEVTVSNQKREAFIAENTYQSPWMVVAEIGGKKKKFLLYASSLLLANEVVSDYVELKFTGMFTVLSAKYLESCIILKDTLQAIVEDSGGEPIEDDSENGLQPLKKFYQIDANISVNDGMVSVSTFVVETKDVDRAMMIIKDHIAKKIKERAEKNQEEEYEFDVKLETAKILSCNYIIDREFSMAYTEE